MKPPTDIHTQTASAMFKVVAEDVTPLQRNVAKQYNYPGLYGEERKIKNDKS